jgi:integrase
LRPKRTLEIDETDKSEKVNEFLNSKAINSKGTKQVYHIGLAHFQTFLSTSEYSDYNIESVLVPISEKSIDVYLVLRKFVNYLSIREFSNMKLSPATVSLYVAGVRSYLEYHDIDITQSKFKKRVPMPKKYYENREGIDAEDIRTLLLACTNTRLKVFILVLASSGMRANEALSLRNCDVDFSQSPTKIHLRPQITKTRQGNDVYISDEASTQLKQFIDSKYHGTNSDKFPNDLIFSIAKDPQTISIYKTLGQHFRQLLEKVGMNERKDVEARMAISFHSFRRFVKTTISNQGHADYSEWILGHRSSMAARYYAMKEQERREIYKKCMKYLTFLDYPTVDSVGKDFEAKLAERDQEISQMNKDLTRLKKFEIDYNETFVERFKEIEQNLEYYQNLYGPQKPTKKK